MPNFDKIQDSGARREFETGAHRDMGEGKGRFDLLPPFAIERLAKHFELGSRKYLPWNWAKGIPFSSFLDSAKRHINKFEQGLEDEDHLIAAVWNLLVLADSEFRVEHGLLPKHLDDLPKWLKQKKSSENSSPQS